jgi:uncharacterized phage-associated protein
MTSAEAVARYFLWLAAGEPEDEPVTHMRLQKLLYYAQGWCLACRGEPLFEGTIEAWVHGPVVREVYPVFARFAGHEIPTTEARDAGALAERDRALIEWVWRRYAPFSASELRRRTHAEAPWRDARGSLPPDAPSALPMSADSMNRFFRAEYRDLCRSRGVDGDGLLAGLDDVRAGRTIPIEEAFPEEWRRAVARSSSR